MGRGVGGEPGGGRGREGEGGGGGEGDGPILSFLNLFGLPPDHF